MLAVDSPNEVDVRRGWPSGSVRTPRSTVAGGRPREVARRRPAGRFVEYGPVQTGRAAVRPSVVPSKARVRVRIALAGMFLVAVLAGGAFGLASLTGSGGSAVPTQTGVAQVHQGETLSALAARVAPQAQRGAVVQRIVELNGLRDVSVRAGQTLVVPLAG